jgi:hypothetical protein
MVFTLEKCTTIFADEIKDIYGLDYDLHAFTAYISVLI